MKPWAAMLMGFLLLCGGGGGAPPALHLAGIWTLRTVNGRPLPFDLAPTPGRVPGDKYQIYAGTLEFTPDVHYYGVRDSLRYTLHGIATDNLRGE
jgi:hypothetical protein